MASPGSFTEFAATISKNAQIIDQFFAANDAIPKPSFTPDGPIGFPCPPQVVPVHEAREAMLDAARKLYYLALGPVESIFELAVRVSRHKGTALTLKVLTAHSVTTVLAFIPSTGSI